MNALSLLIANPEALGVLAVLLCAVLLTAAHTTLRRTTRIPAGALAASGRHQGAAITPPRFTDPDADGRPRPRAPSTV